MSMIKQKPADTRHVRCRHGCERSHHEHCGARLRFSGTRKAAILLSVLGEEAAATILRNLPDEDLQRVTEEVAKLTSVPFETALEVLEEFQQMMMAQDFLAVGGQDVATRLLVKAFGENGGKDDGAAADADR